MEGLCTWTLKSLHFMKVLGSHGDLRTKIFPNNIHSPTLQGDYLIHFLSSCFQQSPHPNQEMVCFFISLRKLNQSEENFQMLSPSPAPHSPSSMLCSLPSLLLEWKHNVGSYSRQTFHLSPDPIPLTTRLHIAL